MFFALDEGKERGAQGWNSTHEARDAAMAAGMHKLYEDAIDSRGQPIERGGASSLRIDRSPDTARIGVGFLHPNELAMKLALKTEVETAIGVAKTVAVFSRDAQLLRRAS